MTLVLWEKKDSVATITFSRPEVRNALSRESLRHLEAALLRADSDPEVHVAILTGADGTFCAGEDLREAITLDQVQFTDTIAAFQRITRVLKRMAKPVIAAIDGYAMGGGLEIICACDLRIASDRAKFGSPEVNIGMVMTNGSAVLLSKIVGEGRAREIVLTGEIIGAAEAYRIGLVNRVVDAARLPEAAWALARRIGTRAPLAVQLSKQLMDKVQEPDVDRSLLYETEAVLAAFCTDDAREGLQAFVEKREPQFQGI